MIVLDILATIWLWFAFWISHIVVLVLQLVWTILFFWLPDKWYRRTISRFHFGTILLLITINPFWWVRVHKKAKKIPKGSIIMFNHICFADAWLAGSALFPHFAFFASGQFVFDLPLLGQVMRLTGHIPVKFGKDETGKTHVVNGEDVMRRSRDLLKNHENLAVFPEGKLSHELHVLEFKLGYFRLAMETDAPIVPVAMWGNNNLYPPGNQFQLAKPGVSHIAFGEPVIPHDFDSPEHLCEHVRNTIIEMQRELPTYPRHDDKLVMRTDSKISLHHGAF